jgi:VWFA-related protein
MISCFAAAMLPAQTPAASTTPATPPPIVRSQTRLVVLDVLVTDSHGNPVKGLTLKDFQLRDDGSVRALKTAEEHGIAAPAGSAAPAPAPASTPASPTVFSNKPPAGEVWNVLLLDRLNPPQDRQQFALQQLKKFVQQLPPEQPVAFVVMDSATRVVVPFSAGVAGIQKILADKNFFTPPSPHLDQEDDAELPPTLQEDVKLKQAERIIRLRSSTDAFTALADWLAHYPGRKNVYWLSTGFPPAPSAVPGSDPQDSGKQELNPYGSDGRRMGMFAGEQAQMDKRLQNARIAVFPIDINGVLTSSDNSPKSYKFVWAQGDRINDLKDIAAQTGGVMRHNDNDIAMLLREEFNHSQDYYTLTYTPSSKNWNGQLRKISLSVKQHGYQLTYRQGYYAVDANFKPLTMDDFNRALTYSAEQVSDLIFSARLKRDSGHIVLDFSIDPRSLQFATAGDGRHIADVDWVVTEFDTAGKLLGTVHAHGEASVTQKQWPGVNRFGLPDHAVVPLEPKLAFLKVGIRDAATGRFGTLEMSFVAASASR